MTHGSPNETISENHVFVSYASQDAAVANSIVDSLESQGLKCWLAPRDVKPGAQYADAIVRAINEAKAVVLVMSANAVDSAHVAREVERAASKRKPIIPFRIDTAALNPELEYFLSNSQWIDVPKLGMPAALAKLREAVGQGSATSSQGLPVVQDVGGRGRRIAIVATIAIGVGFAVGVGVHFWPSNHVVAQRPTVATVTDKSIAVLPFADMSEKKDQEYFGDGMAEEIFDLLVRIPVLKVIGRTSSFQFKGKTEDLRSIGTQLGVAYVLEGSVRKSGDRLRVTAQLIDALDGSHLWSETFEENFGDVLAIQDRIASGIVRALQVTVDTDVSQRQRKLANADAYTLYLRGRHALDRQDESAFQEAQTDFEQALALDPSFLQAAEDLTSTLAGQTAEGFVPVEIGWQRVGSAADQALRLNPNSGLVHSILGLRHAFYEFDFESADKEIAAALKFAPRDPSVLGAAARLALFDNRLDEALRLGNSSIAFDPLSPLNLQLSAYINYAAGKLPAAEAAVRKSMQISPSAIGDHYLLGLILLASSPTAGLKEMEMETPDGGRDAGLAIVYYALGRYADSDSALARLTKQNSSDWAYGIALVRAYRGNRDDAFAWLDRSYSQRDTSLQFLRWEPLLNDLRGDPRYKAFLKKMNLPE